MPEQAVKGAFFDSPFAQSIALPSTEKYTAWDWEKKKKKLGRKPCHAVTRWAALSRDPDPTAAFPPSLPLPNYPVAAYVCMHVRACVRMRVPPRSYSTYLLPPTSHLRRQ